MIRWKDSEPSRLHPQEQALLMLCDRLTILEQAFTAESDRHKATRARLDLVQKDLNRALAALVKLEREHRALIAILEREE
ncbi:MAG: hypothetical protein MUE83_00945 [Tabrizicola sp.]|jgi:hypothetical protein|nr:hypothetical protein [Tabrizicola sp.]